MAVDPNFKLEIAKYQKYLSEFSTTDKKAQIHIHTILFYLSASGETLQKLGNFVKG